MEKEAIKHPRHTNKSETPPYKNSNFTKLKVEKHGLCFVEDIFKRYLHLWKSVYFYANLTFVPKGSNDNKSALFQRVAWHQTGGMPLS